ncbi:hypothetical protein P3342_001541 [Pyrenophora teres f. teres]|nr:hypothetical protein P3342_001541 [Pyrenophora teres f. teres]
MRTSKRLAPFQHETDIPATYRATRRYASRSRRLPALDRRDQRVHNQYQSEHPLSATTPPSFVPTRVSDLSNTGKASYKEDVEDYKGRLEAYKIEDTKYQRERNHLAQVTDFIRTTVSAHLFTNCCKPSQPYRDWITKLAATVGVRAEDELDKARTRYHEAIRPIRAVTQWDTWLTEVDHAVTEGRATGVPECLNDQFIKKDFVSSVSKHFSTWTTSFIVHGLRDPTVTATEMFLQFRQNAQLMHPSKSRSNKAAFAAGGPTLDNEEPDNEKKREEDATRRSANMPTVEDQPYRRSARRAMASIPSANAGMHSQTLLQRVGNHETTSPRW